ncbi:hypothetical protein [Paraburkholderia humisilvae]|uniref:Uncharacterized protein n=1 Tax=Paraburkholderia humisilvae TaxID=627669 RepID=A0A6J5DEB6_9BURK|nr:hypothetical protein [Paraburkholderia humisilvae]CAB3752518.1 hypothetical protein LMG29542_01789 [Paraburkholderia humisilvae]
MSEQQQRKGRFYPFATIGARTERGGRVTSGSVLDNGDVITDGPHREPRTSTIFVPVDEHGVALTRQ